MELIITQWFYGAALAWVTRCWRSSFHLSVGLHTVIWLHLYQEWLSSIGAPNLLDSCLSLLTAGFCFPHLVSANLCSLFFESLYDTLSCVILVGNICYVLFPFFVPFPLKLKDKKTILALSFKRSVKLTDFSLILSDSLHSLHVKAFSNFSSASTQDFCLFLTVSAKVSKPFSCSFVLRAFWVQNLNNNWFGIRMGWACIGVPPPALFADVRTNELSGACEWGVTRETTQKTKGGEKTISAVSLKPTCYFRKKNQTSHWCRILWWKNSTWAPKQHIWVCLNGGCCS